MKIRNCYTLLFYFLIALNTKAQVYFSKPATPFEGIQNGSVTHADIDGDSDIDIYVTGYSNASGTYQVISKMYINDGCGNFTIGSSAGIQGVIKGSANFGDADGDGDQDLLVTGETDWGSGIYITKLYINQGLHTGTFSESLQSFIGVSGISQFVDVDGQNGLDIVIAGWRGNSVPQAERFRMVIYKNDGSGNFTLFTANPFNTLYVQNFEFGDIDGDTDLDLIISSSSHFNIYTNDGSGTFTAIPNSNINPIGLSTLDLEDFDKDGDLDLLISGVDYSAGYVRILKLYKNNGSGTFTEAYNPQFIGYQQASVAINDMDADGDLDFIISGSIGTSPGSKTEIYYNDGTAFFGFGTLLSTSFIDLHRMQAGSNLFLDINGDDAKELMMFGYSSTSNSNVVKLYQNVKEVQRIVACNSYTWLNGITYTQSNPRAGFHTIPGGGVNGCDITVLLDISIVSNSKSEDYVVTDQSQYNWRNGSTYTTEGEGLATYNQTFLNGCSNEVKLNLNLNEQEPKIELKNAKSAGLNLRALRILSNDDFISLGMILDGKQENIDLKGTGPVLVGDPSSASQHYYIARYSKDYDLIKYFHIGQKPVSGSIFSVALGINHFEVDESDNFYIAGAILTDIDFDPTAGESILPIGSNQRVNYIAKYDSQFDLVWVKNLGDYVVNGVSFDDQGNVFLTETSDIDPFNNVFAGHIEKVDPNANTLWRKTMTRVNTPSSFALKQYVPLPNGEFYLTGSFLETVNFSLNGGSNNFTSAYNPFGFYEFSPFIVKYSAAGDVLWAQVLHPSGIGNIVLDDNQPIIYGNFRKTAASLSNPLLNISNGYDLEYYVAKLSAANGSLQWVRKFGDQGMSNVAVSANHTLYFSRIFNTEVPKKKSSQIFKLDENGNPIAISSVESNNGFATINNIRLNSAEDIYSSGGFSGKVDFDPGEQEFFLQGGIGGHQYFYKNAFLAVYNQAPPCATSLSLQSTADDYSSGIILKEVSSTNGTITASNKITGNAKVTYNAGRSVELQPGFTAANGTVFLVEMGGCVE